MDHAERKSFSVHALPCQRVTAGAPVETGAQGGLIKMPDSSCDFLSRGLLAAGVPDSSDTQNLTRC